MVIMSPFDSKLLGYKFPKSEADIVLIPKNTAEYNNISAIKGNPCVIRTPGEFEVKEVMILGFHADAKLNTVDRNTIFRIEIEDINLIYLGALNGSLTNEELEQFGGVDILFIPISGKSTIDAKKAAELVSKVEPSIVIPMCYFDPDLSDEFKELSKVDRFIEIMGASVPEKMTSLKVYSRDFDQITDGTKVIVLEKK